MPRTLGAWFGGVVHVGLGYGSTFGLMPSRVRAGSVVVCHGSRCYAG
jgi:hypothetical protein